MISDLVFCFAHNVSKLVCTVPAVASRCPSHDPSFVTMGLPTALLHRTTGLVVGGTSQPRFESVISDGDWGGGSLCYFMFCNRWH